MISAIVCLALMTAERVDESTRWKKVLENGSIAIVEPIPGAQTVGVALVAAARDVPETPDSHGWRHLLEHMVVQGANGDLGSRLEAKGWILTAETYRDFMAFRMEGPPESLEFAIRSMREVLAIPTLNSEAIDIERKLIDQEVALKTPSSQLSALSWMKAYADRGLDPIGNRESIEKVGVAALIQLHRRQFAADGLCLAVSGAIGSHPVGQWIESVLSSAPKPSGKKWDKRPMAEGGSCEVGSGEAVFACAPGYSNPMTAWLLAAALAIGAEDASRFVTYTPSLQPGLVIVGSPLRGSIKASAELVAKNPDVHFQASKSLAKAWYARSRRTVAGHAFSNAIFQAQAPGGRPETFLPNIEAMRAEDFRQGIEAFVHGARK